jgi:hypothetical protein
MLDVLATIERLEHELRTQDNRITADPIFMVQEEKRLCGFDIVQCDAPVVWQCDDYQVTEESDPEEFKRLEAHYDEHCKEPADWTRTGYLDRWENIQPFLTEQAADEYIRRYAHRHGKLRTYVESGYRNPEWQLLRELFSTGVLRRMLTGAASTPEAAHVAP